MRAYHRQTGNKTKKHHQNLDYSGLRISALRLKLLERMFEVEISPPTALELIAACEAGNRARLSSLVSSIPIQAWTIIPGQAMAQLEPLRVLVWHETRGFGINTSETVTVQVFVDGENSRQFSYRFSADELQLPSYNRLLIDLCRHFQKRTNKDLPASQ